ncbi:hypothetical protein VFPBJ_02044 [Purpureocillium lilacinum]|uniref:Uncharacterized protein n=1 Tax=Purpureocillium lilacinum TaxID=33203 RepID=A0A179HET1_PURLI|nr:hypothetical protein VFPBJ_02044 [Purpureocillium lilacinum]
MSINWPVGSLESREPAVVDKGFQVEIRRPGVFTPWEETSGYLDRRGRSAEEALTCPARSTDVDVRCKGSKREPGGHRHCLLEVLYVLCDIYRTVPRMSSADVADAAQARSVSVAARPTATKCG